MKKIRLVIPLDIWKDLSSNQIWLKVTGDQIEAFEDRELTIPTQKSESNAIVYVNVPEELSMIELMGYGVGLSTPVTNIFINWCMNGKDWRISGLKKVTIIAEDLIKDIPVIDEKPDTSEADDFKYSDRNWAMDVYVIENKTIATFQWHPDLIEESSEQIRKIQLSKRNKLPCMWEKGGLESYEKGGNATIICRENGEKIKPIFVNKGKKCSCAEHALIAVREGYVVIDAKYQKNKTFIDIWQIKSIHTEHCEVELQWLSTFVLHHNEMKRVDIKKEISKFSEEHWCNADIAKKYKDAILAAFDKATHLGCRAPHFVRNLTE